MKEEMKNQMVSPCGLNCSNCEIHKEYDGRDPRDAKAIISLMKPFFILGAKLSTKKRIQLGMLERMLKIPRDQPLCKGCRNEDGHCLIHANPGSCKVYLCTKEKGIHNCSECDEFPCKLLYPSATLSDIAPHNTKILNLCLIKKIGLDKWEKEHSEKILHNYFHGEYPVDL